MIKPNFFIIGAPKSGTTSLAAYLMKHPDVYMPGTWEFNYLADDLKWINGPVVENDEAYLAHFQAGEGYERIGEKSAFYLYSNRAAARIHALNPRAKIICMLRNPVDLLWSFYRYNLQNFEEVICPFEAALAAEADRKAGRRIPDTVTIVQNLYYREIVRFGEQLERYFQLFGSENIDILLFDDFKHDTEREYQKVLAFLEIQPLSLPEYRVHNKGSDLSNLWLRRFFANRPWLKRMVTGVVPYEVRQEVKKVMGTIWRGQEAAADVMDPHLRAQLNEELQSEIKRLSRLLGRDLSHWYSDKPVEKSPHWKSNATPISER